MIAILLAAGSGSRLGDLVRDRPKALLPLGRGVVLDHVVRSVMPTAANHCLVVHSARWTASFARWRDDGKIPVHLASDGTLSDDDRLGAAGDLAFGLLCTEALWGVQRIVVLCADTVFTWPIGPFLDGADARSDCGFVAVRDVDSPSELGRVEIDTDGRVTSIRKRRRSVLPAWLGPMVLPESGADSVARYCDGERLAGRLPDDLGDMITRLTASLPFFAVPCDAGSAWDVGTVAGYEAARAYFSA